MHDSSTVVPRGKVQQKFSENVQEHLAPDPFAVQTAACIIIRVYDAETLSEEGVPLDLGGLIKAHPGWLFAKVELLGSKNQLILPFEESEEQIYFTYGNRVLLEGRLARINYRNQDPQKGSITLQRNYENFHLPLSSLGQVYDIGKII